MFPSVFANKGANPVNGAQAIYNVGADSAAPAQNAVVPAPAPTASAAGGGGYAPTAPAYNAANYGAAQGMVGQLSNIYQGILGNLDNYGASQANAINQGYGQQTDKLNSQYEQNQKQLPWIFASKGSGSGTDAGNAANNALTDYNQGISGINAGRQGDISKLGGLISGNRAQYQSMLDNLGTVYNDANLKSMSNSPYLLSGLSQSLSQAAQQQGTLQPSGTLYNQIMANPSVHDQYASNLASQLSQLAGNSPGATQSVQAGLQSSQDPYNAGYWNDLNKQQLGA